MRCAGVSRNATVPAAGALAKAYAERVRGSAGGTNVRSSKRCVISKKRAARRKNLWGRRLRSQEAGASEKTPPGSRKGSVVSSREGLHATLIASARIQHWGDCRLAHFEGWARGGEPLGTLPRGEDRGVR